MHRRAAIILLAVLNLAPLLGAADAPGNPPSIDPLPPGAIARLGSTRLRPGGRLSALAFSPDGRRLVSWSRTDVNAIRMQFWDAADGHEIRRVD
jgi:hypothetical protein